MNQQINLYQPQFRPRRVAWPAEHFLLAALALALALAGLYAVERQQLERVRDELARARAQLIQWDARVGALQAQHERADEPGQVERVRALRAALRARRDMLRYLERLQPQSGARLSGYLEALARQHQQGMWLTDIRILAGGEHLHLSGSALRPRVVPDFLRALSAESPYAGRSFSSMLVSRPPDDERRIDFVLSTIPGEARP